MWSRIFLAIIFIGAASSSKYTVFFIDEGEVVILTRFKKISRVLSSTGINFKFPWEVIHTFDKRLKSHEESLVGRTSDGLPIGFDMTLFFKIDVDHITDIYKELTKDQEQLLNKIVVPIVQNTTRSSLAKFSSSEVYSKREEIAKMLLQDVKIVLATKYVILSDFQLKKIQLPESIEKAIESKLEKQQSVESLVLQKLGTLRESEIQEIQALGIAKAQKIISSTLTPQYLQKQAIEIYQKLASSTNKTFVILPTNPKSTGIPFVLSEKN